MSIIFGDDIERGSSLSSSDPFRLTGVVAIHTEPWFPRSHTTETPVASPPSCDELPALKPLLKRDLAHGIMSTLNEVFLMIFAVMLPAVVLSHKGFRVRAVRVVTDKDFSAILSAWFSIITMHGAKVAF